MAKELKDWTFDEVVAYNRGQLVLAIGEGTFKSAVYSACNLVLNWSQEQDKKKEAVKAHK